MKITIQDLQARQPGNERESTSATNKENFDNLNRDTLEQDAPSQHTGKRLREDNHYKDSSGDTSMSQHHSIKGSLRGRSTEGSFTKRVQL
ncbi:hypothetical protein VNO78_07919 [Psophocarpus tetragonolobus]|uniref:Uncharacterized protein n=1 Tax=Psophocarpus tetragonolobus TaxID=3891 RepID=A0AAN9XT75_PSOTE